MLAEDKFFRYNDKNKVWQRYCGFLDLSIDEFMGIQERLLMEQIDLVAYSPLGRIIVGDRKPTSVEEFRQTVPLTTYQDYAPYIGDGQEDFLAGKPHYWVHTSHSKGSYKRLPWSYEFHKVQLRNIIASLILASATRKGEVYLEPGCKVLAILPQKPFVSAHLAFGLVEQFSARSVLPLELGAKLPFRQKIDATLRNALTTDVDYIISMTGSFIPMERQFHRLMGNTRFSSLLFRTHPKVSLRLLKNRLHRLFKHNRKLLPRDVWSVKGIVAWGTDSDAFRETTQEQWGKPLFQFYGSSEAGLMAMQDWRRDKMTFLPDSVFLEFIPEEDINREEGISTVLIDELESGKVYEPVITSFYGMPLLRYRQGDLVKIFRRDDGEAGNRLPQLTFHNRADDIIDLIGIARINTQTMMEVLESCGIPVDHWAMRKEYEKGKPVLRLYIELNDAVEAVDLEHRLHRQLKKVDQHYHEAVYTMAYNPVRVVPLPEGAFERYSRKCQNNGHDPDLLTLPHMNISGTAVRELLQ